MDNITIKNARELRDNIEVLNELDINNFDGHIKELIDNGTIICGRIIRENGIVRFERVESSQIDSIPEDERGFATASMEGLFLQLIKMV